jgi:hypothetical protein
MVMSSEHDHAAPTGFTTAELIRECEREIALRRNVYRSRVEAGKMKQTVADRQIALMVAIADRLRAEAERGEL